jgi:hypothetical protein
VVLEEHQKFLQYKNNSSTMSPKAQQQIVAYYQSEIETTIPSLGGGQDVDCPWQCHHIVFGTNGLYETYYD